VVWENLCCRRYPSTRSTLLCSQAIKSYFLKIENFANCLFRLEAEILEKLGRHAQIPQLLAYFEEDEEFYLVEEFIKGHCLKNELIIGKHFPDFTVVNLLKDILGILAFIHKQGVTDIKPGI